MVESAVILCKGERHYCLETYEDKCNFFMEKISPLLKKAPSELEYRFDGDNLYFIWTNNKGSTITIKNHIFSTDNDGCELSFDKLLSELNRIIETINEKEMPEIYERFR